MTMELTGLRFLHKSMQKQNVSSCHFPYQNGRGHFDVLFYVNDNPFILGFGAVGGHQYFEVEILPGYRVKTFLSKENLHTLKEILGIIFATSRPRFSTNEFFADLNAHIPNNYTPANRLTLEKIAHYRRDVEEPEKIYFMGWRDNTKCNTCVSSENLYKTKRLMGRDAYMRAKHGNFSSRWTDDPNRAIRNYTLPS
ncbi:MAG: hypothetical protein IJ113_09205 [Eggerthellaceae bacterium]|nr:hypothetical protein [Eggerthellaceae bacterium]